ncbi:MAG: hypothetical protein ABIL02_07180 [candidate division WOR-3 bacterium]
MKIEDILKKLEAEQVDYAIVGGVAVVLYGYVRFTKDIDLILSFSQDNIEKFARAMKLLNFHPGPPIDPIDLAKVEKREEWIEQKNVRVITFYNPDYTLLQIDVLITKELSEIKTVRRKIDEIEVSIIEYEDLVKMKQESGRPVDLLDIEKLKELRNE